MSLTTLQIERLRRDLGDVADAFDNAELNDNWDRLTSAPDDAMRFEAVKGLCFEQLLNSSSKLHDYTAGAVGEKLEQVYQHLNERFNYYRPMLEAARGQKSEIVLGKIGKRINPNRYTPWENRLYSKRWRDWNKE